MISTSTDFEQASRQSAPEFIEIRGISKRFGGVRALTDVSFSIRSGEIHCLAGEMREGRIVATYNPHEVSEHELREAIHA